MSCSSHCRSCPAELLSLFDRYELGKYMTEEELTVPVAATRFGFGRMHRVRGT